MAKKKINNYTFRPGISFADNLFPSEYQSFVDNRTFLEEEVFAYINHRVEIDTAVNLFPNAVRLLEDNVAFIKAELVAWIAAQVAANAPGFVGYTYDSVKCQRDLGYVLESYIHDLQYGGNEETRIVAGKYWINDEPQVDGDRTPEVYAHQFVRDLINNYIFTLASYTAIQTGVPRDRTSPAAETSAASRITNLTAVLTNTIAGGLDSLADIEYKSATFENYTYNLSKCRRDLGYVLDAYLHDLRYGGTEETTRVVKRYYDKDVLVVDGSGQAEVEAHTFVRNLLANTIFTNTPGVTPYPEAARLLTVNKNYLKNEIAAWISKEIADSVKCERDIGYLIDGVKYDVALGTNYNSVFLGLTEYNATDNDFFVIDTIERTQAEVDALSSVAGSSIALARSNLFFDEVLDITQNGRTAAPTLNFPAPTNATASRIAIRDHLIANRDFLAAEVNAWVAANYPAADHDAAKCSRDVKYAVDAVIYDMLYGGNSATYDQAKFFFYAFASGGATIESTHKAQTVAAYGYLKGIIGQVVLGQFVTPSTGNTVVQSLAYPACDAADELIVKDLIQITADVVNATDQTAANAVLAGITKTYPSITWTSTALQNAFNQIVSEKTNIINEVVVFKGYTYDLSKCLRDSGYVLDAWISDFTNNGNEETIRIANKYYVDGQFQIDGNRIPEIAAYTFVSNVVKNYIFTTIQAPSFQSTYTQIRTAPAAETGAAARFDELSTLFLNFLETGPTSLPTTVSRTVPYQTLETQVVDQSLSFDPDSALRIIELSNLLIDIIEDGPDSIPAAAEAGYGLIKFQGPWKLSDILLITNATRNEVIYNFSSNTAGGEVVSELEEDTDFSKFLQITDRVVKLRLNYDTSSHDASDDIQIFVEGPEQKVRPYDFGTDAIERMRVAMPQSMLDADFEYGLQPTKWQAIGIARGYPSIFEIPGSDFEITNIVTDASFPTNGVGASTITVTTTSPHGLTVGTPITISGLDTSVSGFSRGEGSFIVVTVPSTTTFTYYSKSRVGDTSGTSILTAFTQLRKGGFYTGASIGSPTISLVSNGTSGTFTTKFTTFSGTNRLAFTGTAPSVGAPLVAAAGIGYGSQVTAVVGSGGVVVTPEVIGDYNSGVTTLTLASAAGVTAGLAADNTSNEGTFVSLVSGSDITFDSPFETAIVGNTTTYSNLSGENEVSSGSSATFDVVGNTSSYVSVIPNTAGTGYVVGDVLKLAGTDLSGTSPTNDLLIKVETVDGLGGILGVSIISGTSVLQAPDETITGITDTTYVADTPDSVIGTGAIFDVTRSGTGFSTAINTAGSGYVAGTTFLIPGSTFTGNSAIVNDVTVTATQTGYAGVGLIQNGTTGGGGGATFSITRTGNAYALIGIDTVGTGYATNDEITIEGTQLGGNSPENDVVLVVNSINAGTGVETASIKSGYETAGQASSPGYITQVTTSGTGNENTTVTNITVINVASSGLNSLFTLTRTAGGYTNVIVVNGGTDYLPGNRIRILGSDLGGDDGVNDAIISVEDVDLGTGEILDASVTGVGVNGIDLDLYSSLTLSEFTTAQIDDATDLDFGTLATLQIDFATAHGIIPGGAFIVVVASDNGSNNHNLANGSFTATQVPSKTSLVFQARAPGIITGTPITGSVYARPDSFFVHRPYDGGVQLGTGGPQHGAQAIRQSKKYIRYQSGKGIMYTTGALFAPSYDILDIESTGVEVGDTIEITLGDNDHGFQRGCEIRLSGIDTGGYDGEYTVDEIVTERKFRVLATQRLGSRKPSLSFECQVSTLRWSGAAVRAGVFDDQNGIFWEYDGQYLWAVQRTSTKQLAGTIALSANSNLITGTNTKFKEQLVAGDTIVIRGMTHVVTHIDDNFTMTVNPDFRGVRNVTNGKISKVKEVRARQDDFNMDKLDGTGPSGYNLDITKMQMIGIQYSWYGAGFIDWMLRGSDGNYVFAHRMRNSNVNTEAYMRTGNLPVRYEVSNYGAIGRLATDISNIETVIPLEDASAFPTSGTVYINNELITYTGKTNNNLTGITRGAQLEFFFAGALRNYTGGNAEDHEAGTGVIFVSNTTTPLISHWGSAFLTDGLFDEDRGYIFNYTATNVNISTTRRTAFLIRLAPSVSNAVTGDLGDRELLNRAQLLLKGIEITSDTGTGGIVIEGVLNPQNYPTNPSDILWTGLSGSAQGGQPSFAQIAPGGSVVWSSGSTTTTAAATTSASLTGAVIGRQAVFGGNRTLVSGINYFFVTQTDYNTYISNGLTTGDSITGTGIPANTTITGFQFYGNVGGTNYYRIIISQNANSNVTGDQSFTVTKTYPVSSTSYIFFQKTSWESTGAAAGTTVSDTLFPGGTSVSSTALRSYFGTQYYIVTFTQTTTGAAIVRGTTTITFSFGQPAYALPGETVFSFVATPGVTQSLDLGELKELTNTTLGGRGTFPNGPDVLAINVYKATGSAINGNIIIRWGEAQA